jgi:hypothetical protein
MRDFFLKLYPAFRTRYFIFLAAAALPPQPEK